MDNVFIFVVRLVATIVGAVMALCIGMSERLMAVVRQKNPGNSPTVVAAKGVPAAAAATPATATTSAAQPVPAVTPAPTLPEALATPAPVTPPVVAPEPQIEDAPEPDELDWAGSLSHAAVASLHLGHVLAMVRDGWLVPDEARMVDVGSALDAMEAFQDRTAAAVAPLLDAMTDDQRAEFFGDFDDDFPPALPELDNTP